MKALLLAAGFGTRLRPLTDHTPKCLVPIHGVPLLDIWVHRLLGAGVEDIFVNTHYLPDVVEAHIRAMPYADHIKVLRENTLLGTAGTLLSIRDELQSGPSFVIHGDNLSGIDLGAMAGSHNNRPAESLMTMAVFKTDAPETCGIVEVGPYDLVVDFHEKVSPPKGDLANAAVYMVEPDFVNYCAALEPAVSDLSTEVIPRLLGRIGVYQIDGYHRDIGSPEVLALAHEEVSKETVQAWVGR